MVRRKNVPGPGTYEMPDFYKVGGQVIFNKSAKMGAAAFGSNQSRNQDRSGASATNCHPGQYTIHSSQRPESPIFTGQSAIRSWSIPESPANSTRARCPRDNRLKADLSAAANDPRL